MGYLDSLIQSESGGNWGAQNSEMGAGGKAGHFGRVQFGQARLQDAMNAGAIPQGVTPQQFMASPELQVAAENWHFADLEKNLGPLVGSVVNGRALDMGSLVAMGHLGGAGGARKYVQTGGRYNPSDSFGTSLSDYAGAHGGQSRGAPQGGAVSTQGADTMEQPGGLLGRFKPAEENVGGLLGMIFKNMSPDRADSIRAGLAGMQGVNNQGVYNAAMGRMDGRRASAAGDTQFGRDTALQQQRIDADSAKRQAEQQRAAQMRAQARGWIEQNSPQHLGAFDGGAISVEQVYKAANPQVDPMDAIALQQATVNLDQSTFDLNADRNAPPETPSPTSTIGKLQGDLAAGLINQEQYDVALSNMAPPGMTIESDGQGGFRMVQGQDAGAGTPTERQSMLALFGGLMDETMPEISRMEQDPSFNPASLGEGMAANTGWLGNYLRSPTGQRYQGLQRQWAEGVLRIQTGAAATQDEINRVMGTYFPVPGDTAETIAQKSQQRDAFARSLVPGSGGNLTAPGGAGDRPAIGKTSPQRFKFNPETGAIE
jgi:hypothetical protein